MTEYDGGMIFITAAGEGALLGVATTIEIDVSLIAHRLNELAGGSATNSAAYRGADRGGDYHGRVAT